MRWRSTAVTSLPTVRQAAEDTLKDCRQGDILRLPSLAIELTDPKIVEAAGENSAEARREFWHPLFVWLAIRLNLTSATMARLNTPMGAVVISQTCDVVQSDRLTIQVAPLVELTGDRARQAASGYRPRYVAVPEAGNDKFADLECVASVHKNELVHVPHRHGLAGHEAERDFARAVGRRFSRFPFPDNLHDWLRPLEEPLQEKARRPASPLGQVLDSVTEIRILAEGGWDKGAPYSLTVLIIVKSGTLPERDDDDLPSEPEALRSWLRGNGDELHRSAGQIAEKLRDTSDPDGRYHLWLALGEAFARMCQPPAGASPEVMGEVDSVEGEIVAENELTVDRWWGSEALDLDHLSSPRPR